MPLHRQLAAQLAAALRENRRTVGARLPGGRVLAERLGIDRGTVLSAYHRLAREGLVELKPGSGAYVTAAATGEADGAVAPGVGRGRDPDPFRAFVARERARGSGTAELAGLFERWRAALSARRVIVVDEEPELRELRRRELECALSGIRVTASDPDALRRQPERASGALVATSPRHAPSMRAALPPWVEVVALRAPGGARERRLLLRLAVGAVAVLVSVSPTLRRRFRDLAAGLRGREVAALALAPGASPRLDRGLRLARFVLADVACRPELEGRVESTRLLGVRTVDPALCADLARRLAVGPIGVDPGGPGGGTIRTRRRRRSGRA
ncbi:MAG: GntR family transcriptional regulator [Candidatus Palauibacterales bacterium]|nr:GntR family transcriptional regulator [Candidatus Palauibacterales bacterium]MDP2530071.1 GntR family transcriptional regulator [Candidatus Palauibacterales bacterium]MDP2584539.1 GntR family transcriptional regulator [Candidatus Palauibacterales bacterium]